MALCKIVSYPPLEQLPVEHEIEGKFVQFRWRGIQYLLFATKAEHRFHNQMLGHFLDDHGLPYHWQNDETLSIDIDDMEILGGGRFRFSPDEDSLQLWDNSQAYGRFIEEGLEDCIKATAHPWSSSHIIIN